MDMLAYLTELIKTRKEVGIPGFGTIYKKKSPGRYDAETHSFLPPSYVIDFTQEVREEELLISYICKKKNISKDSAAFFVGHFVEGLKKQLETNQEANLKPIGTVSLISGNWVFHPEQDQNFGFDFYGLPILKEETPEDGSGVDQLNEDHEVTEEQLELENSNADLTEGDPVAETILPTEEPEEVVNYEAEESGSNTDTSDEQPVYEEIAEVTTPAIAVSHQPTIETPEGLESGDDEETQENTARPTINEMYAQSVKTSVPPPPPVKDSSEFYNSQNEDQERTGVPLYLKIFIALLIILIALAAAYFIKPDLFEPILKRMQPPAPISEQQREQALKKTADSLAYADSVKNSLSAPLSEIDSAKKDSVITKKPEAAKPAVAKTATTNPAPTETVQAPIPAGTTYEVIGSSVISQTEADRFIAQMKARGITAKAIAPEKGKRKIKISVATFKDEASARAERPKLEEKLGIEGLYIYTNKPQ